MFPIQMEESSLFALGNMVFNSGDAFLKILLEDLPCTYAIGYVIGEEIQVPPIPRDSRVHLVLMKAHGHAYTMSLNSQAMTVTSLDSMSDESHPTTMKIVEYFQDKGYTYVPHGCPRGRLPQQDDRLCSLWALYLTYRACKGDDPLTLLYSANKEDMLWYAHHIYGLFISSGMYDSYMRLQRIILSYGLSNMSIDVIPTRERYIHVPDKEAYLDTIDRDFPIRDTCDRRLPSYDLISGIISVAARNYPIYLSLGEELAHTCSVSGIVKVIEDTYDPTTARGILYLALTNDMSVRVLIHPDLHAKSIHNSVELAIVKAYAMDHIPYIMAIGDSLGIRPEDYTSVAQYSVAVNKAYDGEVPIWESMP